MFLQSRGGCLLSLQTQTTFVSVNKLLLTRRGGGVSAGDVNITCAQESWVCVRYALCICGRAGARLVPRTAPHAVLHRVLHIVLLMVLLVLQGSEVTTSSSLWIDGRCPILSWGATCDPRVVTCTWPAAVSRARTRPRVFCFSLSFLPMRRLGSLACESIHACIHASIRVDINAYMHASCVCKCTVAGAQK